MKQANTASLSRPLLLLALAGSAVAAVAAVAAAAAAAAHIRIQDNCAAVHARRHHTQSKRCACTGGTGGPWEAGAQDGPGAAPCKSNDHQVCRNRTM
eukprot:1162050-Pelagomonas_calceolata.AAC.3